RISKFEFRNSQFEIPKLRLWGGALDLLEQRLDRRRILLAPGRCQVSHLQSELRISANRTFGLCVVPEQSVVDDLLGMSLVWSHWLGCRHLAQVFETGWNTGWNAAHYFGFWLLSSLLAASLLLHWGHCLFRLCRGSLRGMSKRRRCA